MADYYVLQYAELDLTPCANTYGTTPCAAQVGVTGTFKCHNSPATCQDPANFIADTARTHRFAVPTKDLPADIACIPCIKPGGIQIRAQEIMPTESVGTRESVTITFQNPRHNDVGFDNYISDRGFNTYNAGTLWGKFAARWPNIQGAPLRVIFGEVGQSLSEMETRHYYVESTSGPNNDGTFTIVAKDAIKFLDGKKAQAPLPSTGRLDAAISTSDTSLTLIPAGIGDDEYPNSGIVTVGDEIIQFTRASGSDVLSFTLGDRGLYGSEISAHDDDETVQLALVYTAASPADIIDDLIFSYTDTPAAYQDLVTWQTEIDNYFGRLFSAVIVRPTPIKDLVTELMQQAGLMLWTDVINQALKLKVVRSESPSITVTDNNSLPGSMNFKEDNEKRVSQIYTFYAQRNPLKNLDEDGNYKAILLTVDSDEIKALENLPPAIRKFRSRWITVGNRPAASDLGAKTLERYGDTPGVCSFQLPLNYPVNLGGRVSVQSRIFEDAQGSQRAAQIGIVTRVERKAGNYSVNAYLMRFRQQTSADRVVLIDEDSIEVNLRTIHDLIYTEPGSGDIVTVIVSPGVVVTADSGPDRDTPANHAIDVGSWPAGVAITITISAGAYVVGKGGFGGQGLIATAGSKGAPGGVGLYTRYPITLINNGILGGGGGGGGGGGANGTSSGQRGGGGGGGAALGQPTLPGQGDPGTLETGGAGYTGTSGADGGDGGDLGQAGQAGTNGSYSLGGAGGAAGAAIDGDSYVTYSTAGDIRGSQIN